MLRSARAAVDRLAGRIARRFGSRAEPGAPARPASFGVNVAGYLASEKGIGEGVRSDVRSLRAAGVPTALHHFVDRHGSENRVTGYGATTGAAPHRFNLVHVNPDQVHVFVGEQSADYFEGRYNIGFWVWELSRVPQQWLPCFSYFDEIWVPSTFVLDAVSRVSPVPVVRFPHSVVPPDPAPRPWPRRELGIPDDACVFLFMFDFYSVLERKNPFGLVEAFRRAFGRRDDAWLVLKCSHPEHDPEAMARLERATADANVRLLDRVLDRADLDALMAGCDCYVSLHRSEGFGITIAEAMAREKPVITTGYGGNVDFVTPWNAYVVRHTIRELERDFGPYERGAAWADPDLDHAAEHMRAVLERPGEAAAVARRGRDAVARWLSPEAVGAMMGRRLRLLM